MARRFNVRCNPYPRKASLTTTGELLHALSPAIYDVHGTVLSDNHVVRAPELAISVSEPAESLEHGPGGSHPRCTAAVRRFRGLVATVNTEDRSVRTHRHRVRPSES